jgi:hypothetical protein
MSSTKRESRKATVRKTTKAGAATRSPQPSRASAERELGRLVAKEIERQYDLAMAGDFTEEAGAVILGPVGPCIPWSDASICRGPIPKTNPSTKGPVIQWSPVIQFRFTP